MPIMTGGQVAGAVGAALILAATASATAGVGSVPPPAVATAAVTPSSLCAGPTRARANGPLIVRKRLSLKTREGWAAGVPTFTVRTDGSHLRLLTRPGRHTTDFSLYPSPDGRTATLLQLSGGPAARLSLVNLRSRKVSLLRPGTSTKGANLYAPATFSPDGRWIAYTSHFGAIAVVHPDGSGADYVAVRGIKQPGPPQLTVSHATFSPSGRCLLGLSVTSNAKHNQMTLVAVTPDGGHDAAVTVPVEIFGGMDLQVTPDARYAVFTGTRRPGERGVYMADLANGRVRRIAKCADFSRSALSPDGRKVAFDRTDGTYVKPLAGGHARRLLHRLYVVSWAPRPA